MEKKKYKEKYSRKVDKKKMPKKIVDLKWVLTITITAFLISMAFSFLSETVISNVGIVLSIILLFIVIGIGVLFDMIGISVTVADINTFNSMASKRVGGATVAVKFIKNAEKLSSFCNDVIGDICGIVSGSAGVTIAASLSEKLNTSVLYTGLVITALTAALTIGGKAFCKSIAIKNSNQIVHMTAKVLSIFEKKKK